MRGYVTREAPSKSKTGPKGTFHCAPGGTLSGINLQSMEASSSGSSREKWCSPRLQEVIGSSSKPDSQAIEAKRQCDFCLDPVGPGLHKRCSKTTREKNLEAMMSTEEKERIASKVST